jgi:hypothetical protein
VSECYRKEREREDMDRLGKCLDEMEQFIKYKLDRLFLLNLADGSVISYYTITKINGLF